MMVVEGNTNSFDVLYHHTMAQASILLVPFHSCCSISVPNCYQHIQCFSGPSPQFRAAVAISCMHISIIHITYRSSVESEPLFLDILLFSYSPSLPPPHRHHHSYDVVLARRFVFPSDLFRRRWMVYDKGTCTAAPLSYELLRNLHLRPQFLPR